MTAIEAGSVLGLLGDPGETLQSFRTYRSVGVSLHGIGKESCWAWSAQPSEADGVAGIAYFSGPVEVQSEGRSLHTNGEEQAVLFHPHRDMVVARGSGVGAAAVWVPWSALEEVDSRATLVIDDSPVSAGLRPFILTLLTRQTRETLLSEYFVERLLTEMSFGSLAEACSVSELQSTQADAVQQSKHLMLVNHAQPGYGVDEVAQALHLSTRQLQRLFAGKGLSPAAELRRIRADSARKMLENPDYGALTIEQIAQFAGFGSRAALNRALASQGYDLLRTRVR